MSTGPLKKYSAVIAIESFIASQNLLTRSQLKIFYDILRRKCCERKSQEHDQSDEVLSFQPVFNKAQADKS